MPEFSDYAHMLEFLTVEVKNKSSGTLFIRTNCNHSITFVMENGRIISVLFGPRKGDKAIAKIREITGGSYRFDRNNIGSIPQDLPSTEEILAKLSLARERPKQAPLATDSSLLSDSSSLSDPSSLSDSSSLSESDRALVCYQLKEVLTTYLGPIAEIVLSDAMCDTEQFCSTSEQAKLFVNQLAEDIEDPAMSVQFRSQANSIIENMFKT